MEHSSWNGRAAAMTAGMRRLGRSLGAGIGLVRGFLLGLGLGILAGPAAAQADDFPNRPVTIVVPGAPGGGGDFTARLLADGLGKALGKPVVVENRAGAAGNIAATYVARAQPDGYTPLLGYAGTHVANPALFSNLQWDPIKSFDPVALVITSAQVLVVGQDFPAKTFAEFIDYARKNPGKIDYASSGNGTVQHIGAALLAQKTGVSMVHVPYRGAGAALADVMSGQVEMMLTTPPAVVGQVRSGKLRALAIAGRARHPMLPDVPTTAEAGVPGIELDAWFAIYAPAGTPKPAIERLAAGIRTVVDSDAFKRRAEESGTYATYKGPAELADYTRSELAFWSDVIRQAGIKAE